MSQSAEKVDTQAIEKLSRRKAATASRVADLDRERGEAKQIPLGAIKEARLAFRFS